MINPKVALLREVVVKLTPMIAGKGLRVTQVGAKAFAAVDPKTLKPIRINIPHIADDADDAFLMAIQGFIDHEVAHILFTDWKAVLATEAHGEKLAEAARRNPKTGAKDMHWFHNVVEDPFIERLMQNKFKGSAYNLDRLHEMFLERITKPAVLKSAADPIMQFGVLLVPITRAWSGQIAFQRFMTDNKYWDLPLVKAFVDALPKSVVARMPTLKTSWDALEIADAYYKVLRPFVPPPPSPIAPPCAEPAPEPDDKDESEPKDTDKTEADGKGKNKDKPEDAEDKGSEGEKSKEKPDDAEKPAGDSDDEPGADESADPVDEEADGASESDAPADDADADSDGAADADPSDEADAPEEAEEGADDADDGTDDSDTDEDGDGDPVEAGSDDEDGEEEGAGASGSGSEDDAGDEADDDAEGAAGGGPDDSEEESGGGGVSDDDDEPRETDGADPADGDKAEATPGTGSSPFSERDVDVEGIDISSAISGILTDMATKATRGADYRVYTRDMDKIEELEVPSSLLPEAVATLEDQTRHMVAPMQKNIERMMASKSQVLKVPGFRSGRLHSAGLHRLATKDDRIFRRRHETTSKETAVTLLIDNSGSMRQGVRSKDGSYKTKIEVAMAAGYALSQTLERVGIKHEVIGFTTKELKRGSKYLEDLEAEEARIGRGFSRMEPLHMPIFKGFDERLTPETKKRFTMPMNGMPLLNNIDGESLRVAALRLVKRSEKRKVIIVLSDGNPACSTRHPGEINSDLHRAVAECGKMHIDLVGLGIMDVSVREFYPRCVVLNDLADLPGAVMGELKRILTAA